MIFFYCISDDCTEKTVSVLLDGQESDIYFIDPPLEQVRRVTRTDIDDRNTSAISVIHGRRRDRFNCRFEETSCSDTFCALFPSLINNIALFCEQQRNS